MDKNQKRPEPREEDHLVVDVALVTLLVCLFFGVASGIWSE